MAVTEETLYLTTDGIYHTDSEVADERQQELNNKGGRSEAIDDLSAFIKSRLSIGSSKYWGLLYSQSLSSSKSARTDGIEMFKDLFTNNFGDMYILALSIAAHKYTLPVNIVWQTQYDLDNPPTIHFSPSGTYSTTITEGAFERQMFNETVKLSMEVGDDLQTRNAYLFDTGEPTILEPIRKYYRLLPNEAGKGTWKFEGSTSNNEEWSLIDAEVSTPLSFTFTEKETQFTVNTTFVPIVKRALSFDDSAQVREIVTPE